MNVFLHFDICVKKELEKGTNKMHVRINKYNKNILFAMAAAEAAEENVEERAEGADRDQQLIAPAVAGPSGECRRAKTREADLSGNNYFKRSF